MLLSISKPNKTKIAKILNILNKKHAHLTKIGYTTFINWAQKIFTSISLI